MEFELTTLSDGDKMAVDIRDVSQLKDLSEETIVDVLKERYYEDKIYTNCGGILIALNPWKDIPIYDTEHHEKYPAFSLQTTQEPHIFRTAAHVFTQMRRNDQNQIVFFSGESGAGKTKSTQLMLTHLMHVCNQSSNDLHDKMFAVNPLLESFGNAKTSLNDNSSRFGKLLQIHFSGEGLVTGGAIRDYMLEKSRVTKQSPDEGNFHIFYALLAGAKSDVLKSLHLEQSQKYRILRSTNQEVLANVTQYGELYEKIIQILNTIGLEQEELDVVNDILAAILHLTNVRFEADKTMGVFVQNGTDMAYAAELLCLGVEQLATVLVTSNVNMAGEQITKLKTLEQANDGRDAMAKALYERLFGWLVRQINLSLNKDSAGLVKQNTIGIIDISGFENLSWNSFEQLCINIVNEKLQGFLSDFIFKDELSIYQKEGIPITNITYPRNDEIIQLFFKRHKGIMDFINEESKFPEGTDETLVQKLNKELSKKEAYQKTKATGGTAFGINHFAGTVWYTARTFLEKNRDTLSKDIVDCLKTSKNFTISDMFTVKRGPTGTISTTRFNYRKSVKVPKHLHKTPLVDVTQNIIADVRSTMTKQYPGVSPVASSSATQVKTTAITHFIESMKDLVNEMKLAEPHFVRCLKPNDEHTPDRFEEAKVKKQLLYNGVTAVANIRKFGYPIRKSYREFAKRYRIFGRSEDNQKKQSDKESTLKILAATGVDSNEYAQGRNQIFIKETAFNETEGKLHKYQQLVRKSAATKIQRYYRQNKKRKEKEMEANEKRNENTSLVDEDHPEESDNSQGSTPPPRNYDNGREVTEDSSSDDEGPGEPVVSFKPILIESGRPRRRRPHTPPPTRRSLGESDDSGNPSTSSTQSDTQNINEAPSETSESTDVETEQQHYWDIFLVIPREIRNKGAQLGVLKAIKLLFFLLFFLVVLGSAVAQKLSLVRMTHYARVFPIVGDQTSEKLADVQHLQKPYYTFLLIAIVIPYIWSFLANIGRVFFANMPRPNKSTMALVMFLESMHTVGLCMLTFWILPFLDPICGVAVLSSSGMLPSILNVVCAYDIGSKDNPPSKVAKIMKRAFDILSIFLQFSAIVVVSFLARNARQAFPKEDMTTWISKISVSLFLCSFGTWETYLDDNVNVFGAKFPRARSAINFFKFDLHHAKNLVRTFVSIWKIGLSVMLAYLFSPWEEFKFEITNTDIASNTMNWLPVILLTVCPFLAYYVGYVSCKLQLQEFAFSFALLLSTPITILILAFSCKINVSDFISFCPKTSVNYWLQNFYDESAHAPLLYLLCGLVWSASLYWITRHIWFPKQERLAKIDRLYMLSQYCAVHLESFMVLNRKRHNRRIVKRRVYGRQVFISRDEDRSSAGDLEQIPDEDDSVPMIYACATMWHETSNEMVQLLKSLFRLDDEQAARRHARMLGVKDPDYFTFESHIFFDDAMEWDDDEDRAANSFVKLLVSLVDEAASCVHQQMMELGPPVLMTTPYGGQLIWEMPGGNFLFVHLKDKNRIRHRKRWSQVMYMYFLLGYRLISQCQDAVTASVDEHISGSRFHNPDSVNPMGRIGKSDVFKLLDDEMNAKAENTFLLALDGDVDFSPEAVRLLVDRLKKNPKVGAACGRIHPIGSGPIVWFQKFEYAVGHWLQKATEHVLGCVLCSPGCFSMFRGSALMDDNVMKKYTSLPTNAGHYLQYDQGEDRWLCTLLLQQGYRVDYCAASDAFTYAPETFKEFFNQRRRWMPSTMANVMDLLSDAQKVVFINDNISYLYIFYQVLLMGSTLVGPATIIMMIAGAFRSVFDASLLISYVLSLTPAIIFFAACFLVKTDYQLALAGILSALYAFVMTVVLVGVIAAAASSDKGPFDPSVLFTTILVFLFLFTGIIHPQEFSCLIPGFLYFLVIPSGYLVLVIYSMVNMHVVSWGTREVPKKKTKRELQEEKELEEEARKKKEKEGGFLSRIFGKTKPSDIIESMGKLMHSEKSTDASIVLLKEISEQLKTLSENLTKPNMVEEIQEPTEATQPPEATGPPRRVTFCDAETLERFIEDDDDFSNKKESSSTKWMQDPALGKGLVLAINDSEKDFWDTFISKYLYPIDKNKQAEEKTAAELISLRTNVCFGLAIINLLWLAVNVMFQFKRPFEIELPYTIQEKSYSMKLEPLGLLFIFAFMIVILIQFVSMILHRWGTLMHLVAITEIKWPWKKDNKRNSVNNISVQDAITFCRRLMHEPTPDYDIDDEEELDPNEPHENAVDRIRASIGAGQLLGKSINFSVRNMHMLTRSVQRNTRYNERVAEYLKNTLNDMQAHDEENDDDDGRRRPSFFRASHKPSGHEIRASVAPDSSGLTNRKKAIRQRNAEFLKKSVSAFVQENMTATEEPDAQRKLAVSLHASRKAIANRISKKYNPNKTAKGTLGKNFVRNMTTVKGDIEQSLSIIDRTDNGSATTSVSMGEGLNGSFVRGSRILRMGNFDPKSPFANSAVDTMY